MDAAETADDETSIELLYVRGGYARDAPGLDPDGDLFQLTRDLVCFGPATFEKVDINPAEALFAAYASIGEATLPTDAFDTADELLEQVYRACQGPGSPDTLPYEGDRHRSMMLGDVIVVDGTPHMVAEVGFERLDVDIRGHRGDN
ncbi:hypothetical protein BV210_02480 [Halorientalis sp. IM1011]|uniref:hypothetical protein n=1 Tax=Halorientalis sp. IM1011 TaxID=1932360 RepID=UPI00097CC99F|nr:hypothetical protein [Halorientalis sp. IM1011]AQL41648.1 hypothetical protein BV210_02480 [Halorientalis sp. IM1011]